MAKKRVLTCIVCPRGCGLTVDFKDDGTIDKINGFACKRGERYAIDECTAPRRTVTSTVRVSGGGVLAVKTRESIPKEMVFSVMHEIAKAVAEPTAHIGDVIISDVLGTGVDVVATANAR